jgi:class 3 adenylate cyclase
MGVNVGSANALKDVVSRRVEYVGPMINAAVRIAALTHGGQIVVSQATHDRFNAAAREQGRFVCLGSLRQSAGN